MEKSLTLVDYQSLAELRYEIRRFLHFSEQAAREAGLEPRQHQLMLTLKGLPVGTRPRIGELAERLQIQHHSTVELVNRLAAGGYVKRHRAGEDRREVLLSLTPKGEKILRDLSLHHKAELRMRGPALVSALKRAMQTGNGADATRPKRRQTAGEKNNNARNGSNNAGLPSGHDCGDRRASWRYKNRGAGAVPHGADVVSCGRDRAACGFNRICPVQVDWPVHQYFLLPSLRSLNSSAHDITSLACG